LAGPLRERRRYTRSPVKSSVETLEGNKVKLYVEVDETEFEHDIDRAFKLIAKEVNLPGSVRARLPRKVLEARSVSVRPASRRCATPCLSISPRRCASTRST
jgi:hypothetical protein